MTHHERVERFKQDKDNVTASQMCNILEVTMSTVKRYEQKYGPCLKEDVLVKEVEPKEFVDSQKKLRRLSETDSSQKKQIKTLVEDNERLERELEAVLEMRGSFEPIVIKPSRKKRVHEAVPFLIASDWHLEETVDPATVSGLNEFNLEVARERIQNFWRNSLKLLQKQTRDVEVKKVVLALLGDFISGSIHDELMESNSLSPTFAIIEAQEQIAGGIQYLLDNTDFDFEIPCHTGNHGRMGERKIATEAGNSLEYYMYWNLRNHFKDNPRINFHISKGYHSYVEALGYTVRLHHGHYIRYGGGVGGPTIPTLKAIANWNTGRWADYDVFGHLHMFFPADTFIINGSVIGWNAFASSIKAKYSKHAVQTFFLIQKGKGRTIVAPIFCD